MDHHYTAVKEAAKQLADATAEWAKAEPETAPINLLAAGIAALILDPTSWMGHLPKAAHEMRSTLEVWHNEKRSANQEAN